MLSNNYRKKTVIIILLLVYSSSIIKSTTAGYHISLCQVKSTPAGDNFTTSTFCLKIVRSDPISSKLFYHVNNLSDNCPVRPVSSKYVTWHQTLTWWMDNSDSLSLRDF